MIVASILLGVGVHLLYALRGFGVTVSFHRSTQVSMLWSMQLVWPHWLAAAGQRIVSYKQAGTFHASLSFAQMAATTDTP